MLTIENKVESAIPESAVKEMEEFLEDYYLTYGGYPREAVVRVRGRVHIVRVIEVRNERAA